MNATWCRLVAISQDRLVVQARIPEMLNSGRVELRHLRWNSDTIAVVEVDSHPTSDTQVIIVLEKPLPPEVNCDDELKIFYKDFRI